MLGFSTLLRKPSFILARMNSLLFIFPSLSVSYVSKARSTSSESMFLLVTKEIPNFTFLLSMNPSRSLSRYSKSLSKTLIACLRAEIEFFYLVFWHEIYKTRTILFGDHNLQISIHPPWNDKIEWNQDGFHVWCRTTWIYPWRNPQH